MDFKDFDFLQLFADGAGDGSGEGGDGEPGGGSGQGDGADPYANPDGQGGDAEIMNMSI
ncbi:MAG: hypothetical protein Q4C55_07360 [Eubacterium sp.]|nr:hypothetical protein [Eubacterium sp.]